MRIKPMILLIIGLICLGQAMAATFLSVKTSQLYYENGDLLTFFIIMDDPSVKITMDASVLDPYFRSQDVLVTYTSSNRTFTIMYPLSFDNTLPTGTYPVLFNAYNPITKVSDALTYNVERRSSNIIADDIYPSSLIIKVKKGEAENILDVPVGKVKICFPDGRCIDQNQAWYDQANAPLPDYEKAIDQKLTSIEANIKSSNSMIQTSTNEVKGYVDSNTAQLSNAITRFDNTVQTLGQVMNNQTQQTQQALKTAAYISVGGVVALFLMTLLILYVLYMRYGTSWNYW